MDKAPATTLNHKNYNLKGQPIKTVQTQFNMFRIHVHIFEN